MKLGNWQRNLLIGSSLISLAAVLGLGFWILWMSREVVIGNKQESVPDDSLLPEENLKPKVIIFVGDMMLDRGVEYQMKKQGFFYPFAEIEPFLREADIVFGNLEGPIVTNPPHFSDESMMFAFSPEAVEGLSFSHFNLLSLANNHTLNMQGSGLEETKQILQEKGIDFVGHPIDCDYQSAFVKDGLGFLAINKTFSFNCSDEEVIENIRQAKSESPSDFLIIIFHWGEEYQLQSSSSQQELAHKAIEVGADLVLGSHSHVVQEIEIYQEKLIFYSLSNFIFDQYFSLETQRGLAVKLEIWPGKLVFNLLPMESILSQSFLMASENASQFLAGLAKKSSPELFEQIKAGLIIQATPGRHCQFCDFKNICEFAKK